MSTDLERMDSALTTLKDALAIHVPQGDVYDGGNFLVVEFKTLFDACEFAKNFTEQFDIRIETGMSLYLEHPTSIIFHYK